MATEEQLLSNNTTQFRFGVIRVGQRLTVTNRVISRLSFKLFKSGSPTGNVTYTIRKVSDDSLLASQLLMAANSLQTTTTWEELVLTTPIFCNEEVRILAECPSGDFPNFANISFQGAPSTKDGEEQTSYVTDWTDHSTYDLAYIYTYELGTASTVTTQTVTNIDGTTATGNGNITSIGNNNPTAHGVCWNTTGTPTTSDSKTDEGATSSTGAFTTSMTGLTAGTKYYVRAYVTAGTTAYGNEVVFWADKGTVYPSDAITRVTNLIHRYNRDEGVYDLELALGEVTSDFGLPEWLSKPQPSTPEKVVDGAVVEESVQKAIDKLLKGPTPPVTETGLPGVTMPFTTTMPTPEKMAELAGMSQTVYDKIIKQGKVTEALEEFGPITGPADLEKFKAKYPELGIGQGIPSIGTPEYTRWMLGLK